jgi:pentatricopeptide repeat protein
MGLTARNVGTNASANRIHLFVMTRVSARTFKTYRGTFQSLEANHRQPKDGFLLKPRQSSTHCALDAVAVMSRSKYKGALQCRGKPPMVLRPTSALNRELITADFNDDLQDNLSSSGVVPGQDRNRRTETKSTFAASIATSELHVFGCSQEVDTISATHVRLESEEPMMPGSSRRSEEYDSNTEQFKQLADRRDAQAALRLLDTLKESTALHNVDFRASLTNHNLTLRACKRSRPPFHIEARRLLLQMRECGPSPTLQTYHEVIATLARAHEWKIAERTFAELRLDFPEHIPSIKLYTSLISAYGKGGQWDKAKSAFDTLVEENITTDTGVYNALLSAAVSAARYREASHVFEQMPQKGISRNVTTYNAILTSLGRQRRVRDMELVHKDMRKSCVEPNETTISVLITANGNAGNCYRAFEHLEEACDCRWLKKSAIIFNSALGACVKSGEIKLAHTVLSMMRAEAVIPTLVTYNTLLMSASAQRDWNEVVKLYLELLQQGLTPDAITFDCICGIEKLQSAADARALALSTTTPSVQVAEYKSPPTQNADGKMSQFSRGKFNFTDLGTLPELFRNTVNELDVHAAYHLFGGSSSDKSTFSTSHAYDALLRALHISGQDVEVETVFKVMISRRVARTVHTYNSLIASYEVRRQWQQAAQAMISMQEEGITPDALTFDALINVCEEMGQWDRATAWLEQAQEQGHFRCEDELGVLDLHRIRSAGTAQTVLRWWLRRMRSRALAPLDMRAAGQGTRIILENATMGNSRKNRRTHDAFLLDANIPLQIRDLPDQIQVVTGWGKHSTVFGYSPVKERVLALLSGLNSPFIVPEYNIGCVVAERGDVRAWLVRDELLSLVRFLGGNRAALRRNFNPLGVDARTF